MDGRNPKIWLQSDEGKELCNYFRGQFKKLLGNINYAALNDAGYLEDFVKIAAVLNNKEVVVEQLKKMNAGFQQMLLDKDKLDKQGNIQNKPEKDYPGNYKVVEEFFHIWAGNNGFNQKQTVDCIDTNGKAAKVDLPAQTPTAAGSLSTFAFQFMLNNGYLFRDKGAMHQHGEFTHMAAVYILDEANKQYEYLDHSILDLYKKLGEPVCQACTPTAFHSTLWDPIFDSSNATDKNLLNQPLRLHMLLSGKNFSSEPQPDLLTKDQQRDLAIIREITLGRINKRIEEKSRGDYFSYEDKANMKNGICVNNILFRSDQPREEYVLSRTPKPEINKWLLAHQPASSEKEDGSDYGTDYGGMTEKNVSKKHDDSPSLSRSSGGGMFGGRVEQDAPSDDDKDMEHDKKTTRRI